MVLVLIIAVLALPFGTLFGWFAHWMIHQRWAGRLHKAHMTHHLEKYPHRDLLSDSYRHAGTDDGLLVFVPVITGLLLPIAVGLYFLGVPVLTLIGAGAVLAVIGGLHDYVHTAFHLRGVWLERFAWFQRLRTVHFAHHRRMRYNLGIVSFVWDRILGTFSDPSRPKTQRSSDRAEDKK